jgi:hypothetical protein
MAHPSPSQANKTATNSASSPSVSQVEGLLNQLSEVSMRYCEARPSLDAAEARAKELQLELETMRGQLEEHKAHLADQEEQNKRMYLKMYSKGQEAARIERADQVIGD